MYQWLLHMIIHMLTVITIIYGYSFFFCTFFDISLYLLNIQSIWKNGPQVAPPLPVASMAGMAALPGRAMGVSMI